jgi:hypothetical protein
VVTVAVLSAVVGSVDWPLAWAVSLTVGWLVWSTVTVRMNELDPPEGMLDRVHVTVRLLLTDRMVHDHPFGVMLAKCSPDVSASLTTTRSAASGPRLLTLTVYVSCRLTYTGLGVRDRLIPRSATRVPAPDSATVCWLGGALSAKLSLADRDPVADGVNVTCTVHD